MPGAGPKCLLASLSLGPLSRRVLVPNYYLIRNWQTNVASKDCEVERLVRVLTSGGEENELVEGEHLSACLDDSGSGGLSHSEGGHCQLGNFKKSLIISHCSDNHCDSASKR